MIQTEKLTQGLRGGEYDERLKQIYGAAKPAKEHAARYLEAISGYETSFGAPGELALFSAPGRTEIGGNHTDHQHGCVLAGSVDCDIVAAAAPNGENVIRVQSQGFPLDEISLDELTPNKSEYNRASALIRGVAAKLKQMGHDVRGFNAYTTSNVLKGSGLSSSAAFEVMIGNIINGLFCGGAVDSVTLAKIGQYSENVFFGKPCGLMDQMASSVGGIISIDFADTQKPVIKKIDFDFSAAGHALCIIDSGADHADLTDEYASIPREMCAVAEHFNKPYLHEVTKQQVLKNIPAIRKSAGDRALLRAIHYYADNERALKEAEALQNGSFDAFLSLVRESGQSSYMFLQNVCVSGSAREQSVAVVLALCGELLGERGAYRVHGGGFAGTVQAFVPLDMLESFRAGIDAALGNGMCHVMSIRPAGGIRVI